MSVGSFVVAIPEPVPVAAGPWLTTLEGLELLPAERVERGLRQRGGQLPLRELRLRVGAAAVVEGDDAAVVVGVGVPHTPNSRPSGPLTLTKNPQVTQAAGADWAIGASGPWVPSYHRSAASSRPSTERNEATPARLWPSQAKVILVTGSYCVAHRSPLGPITILSRERSSPVAHWCTLNNVARRGAKLCLDGSAHGIVTRVLSRALVIWRDAFLGSRHKQKDKGS